LNYIMVALGGMLGSLARYIVTGFVSSISNSLFPYGTLTVNLAGSFLLSLLSALFIDKLVIDPNWRIFVTTGFLGAFTTFSTLQYETLKLWEEGMIAYALLNSLGSVAAGFTAAWLGLVVSRLIF